MEENGSEIHGMDSEDEYDWEEVEMDAAQLEHLEITIQARPKVKPNIPQKRGISHAERLLRIECHKVHTVALLANAQVRNSWINDPLLHARLLSLTPLALQNAFAVIHKSRIPDQNQRGRMFETAMNNLVDWWANSFFQVESSGHIRNRTFDEVQNLLNTHAIPTPNDPDCSTLNIETLEEILGGEVEVIRSSKSLMKHALMRSGSRDTSSQLFTALCRGLGIPARLVVSLQSVPWQAGVGKPKPKYNKKQTSMAKGKGREDDRDGEDDDEKEETEDYTPESISFPGVGQKLNGQPSQTKAKGKEKAKQAIKLRKQKVKGSTLGTSRSVSPSRLASPDPVITPPVFWTEVFSRPDARWMPVDPIRAIVNKRKVFDPSPISTTPAIPIGSTVYPHPYAPQVPVVSRGRGYKEENRMLYVVAFEEDAYARDVTRRYAREFSAKVAKMQGGSVAGVGGGGKGRQAWWDRVLNSIKRPYQLHRDDLEDMELEAAQVMEGMPTTISGFKDHPLYVLSRHLKKNETIYPPPPETTEMGKFRGEPVYSRSSVVSLKTAENWMRSEGRTIIAGSQQMKMVKVRPGTVNRMRELEVLKDELSVAGSSTATNEKNGEIMQGLYARFQTELYVPDPVIGGKVPKNTFGNIDLYVPSMLPRGAAHIPYKGVAKIARKLCFDFAEAVTGFEFKKRRAFPVIEGVVVAQENEAALIEAYLEDKRQEDEKLEAKKKERVMKLWKRVVHGLRVRQRLQEQYASRPQDTHFKPQLASPVTNNNHPQDEHTSGGGFLLEADDVVEAFHLPKYQHVTIPITPPMSATAEPLVEDQIELDSSPMYDFETTMDIETDSDQLISLTEPISRQVPKTMRELAEIAERLRDSKDDRGGEDDGSNIRLASTTIPSTNGSYAPRTEPTKHKRGGRTAKNVDSSTKKRRRETDEDSDSSSITESLPKKRTIAPTPTTRVLRPRIKTSYTQPEDKDS